jgi:hypothetical protein
VGAMKIYRGRRHHDKYLASYAREAKTRARNKYKSSVKSPYLMQLKENSDASKYFS